MSLTLHGVHQMQKFILLFLIFSFTAFAELPPIREIIGESPEHQSEIEKQDFEQLFFFQGSRTKAQCDQAAIEEKANVETFFTSIQNPLLTPTELKSFTQIAFSIKSEVIKQVIVAKQMFKRPRPYDYNHDINPCIKLEPTYAFPSGHASLAFAYAQILSFVFPERETEFFKRAEEVGLNRVIGGVHHPSDIVAGKKLGLVMAKDMLSREEFIRRLREIQY